MCKLLTQFTYVEKLFNFLFVLILIKAKSRFVVFVCKFITKSNTVN